MNNVNNVSQTSMAESIFWGVVRGGCVHPIIYPLEVIKIHLQCARNQTTSIQIAQEIFQTKGLGALYNGLKLQLIKTSAKQIIFWPLITREPVFLKRCGLGNFFQQSLTGLTIATLDAAVMTPIERSKIVFAWSGTNEFSLNNIYKNGWRGFTTHWKKLSVNWSTCLVAQKYLRDFYRKTPEQKLTLLQLTGIGAQVAIIVSIASAPFDLANTLKFAKNVSKKNLFSRKDFHKLRHGWYLSALALTIQNIASVIVIDCLDKRK